MFTILVMRVSESILEAYGLSPKSEQVDKLRPKACPNCSEPNKVDSKFCAKCRMVLDYDAYTETIEQKEEQTDKLAKMEKKQEKFELIIQSLIDSGQLKPNMIKQHQLLSSKFLLL